MLIIPAIDIKDGKCAQLVGGKPGTERFYGDAIEVARSWEEKEVEMLHVIDLDAALGSGSNWDIVLKIKKSVSAPIQYGGGIRDIDKAREILDSGIERVILGTLAMKQPDVVRILSKEYGKNRILVALDSVGGKVVIKGWQEKTEIKTKDMIEKLRGECFGFLVTDVDQEGLMKGIDTDEFKEIAETGARIIASGGISSPTDVNRLRNIGIWGCVLGKILYEKPEMWEEII